MKCDGFHAGNVLIKLTLTRLAYSTISLGYAGLYECVKYMTGHSHTDNGKGKDFALEVMQALNDACKKWKEEEDIDYSVYGTPIESTTYKFAKCLRDRFGVIKGITDRDYITNSYEMYKENLDSYDLTNREEAKMYAEDKAMVDTFALLKKYPDQDSGEYYYIDNEINQMLVQMYYAKYVNNDLIEYEKQFKEYERMLDKLDDFDWRKFLKEEKTNYLNDINKPLWIRQVLVPGITDKEEDLLLLKTFIESLKNVENVVLYILHWRKRNERLSTSL
mgnify:CR=1 FL=1